MGLAVKAKAKAFVDRHETLWKLKRRLYQRLYDRRDDRRGAPSWVMCPQDIQIDTHNYCSSTHRKNEKGELEHVYAGCIFCNVKAGGAFNIPRGRMPTELIRYIIDYWSQYRDLGAENICPYVNGDPIIDDRLPWICNYSQEKGMKVVIDTSANVYANRDWLVHPNITQLRFSVSAITDEVYMKTQGCPKFGEALRTIHYVLENKYPTQTVEMHFMVNKYNEHEIEDYISHFNGELGLKVKIFPLHEMPDIQLNSTVALPSPKWRNVSTSLEAWMESRPVFIYPSGYRERQVMRANRTCQGMAYAVQWDGLILHCTDAPPDYEDSPFFLGYVKADGSGQDMLEAWHLRNRQRIRHPACRACNAKRPDWCEILQKFELATADEVASLP